MKWNVEDDERNRIVSVLSDSSIVPHMINKLTKEIDVRDQSDKQLNKISEICNASLD